MTDVGKVDWAPDYGIPLFKPTQCRTGTHIWLTIGREPKPGDRCHCGLHEWGEYNTGKERDK